MKKMTIVFTALLLVSNIALGQEVEAEKKKNKAKLVVSLTHNSASGFYPYFLGIFETNKSFDVTVYSIFWTNSMFGNIEDGTDYRIEVGAGLGFKLLDKKLYLNPTLGFSSGKFLSNDKGTKVGEGIIPTLLVLYQDKTFHFEGYLSYYKSLRDSDDILTKDFFLNWMAPGIKIGNRVILGAYFDYLEMTRLENGSNKVIRTWLGPSIKLNFDKGISFRFSAGKNLKTDVNLSDEFYKASVFIPF